METTGKLPAHIQLALDGIDDNAMAISGISRLIYDLKLENDELSEEAAKEYPALARVSRGVHDCDFMRAIKSMAESINEQVSSIESYLERHFS